MMAGSGRQLTLELPQRPALDRADFLVAPSNAAAVAWIDRWPDWPHRVLTIYGQRASGKSHLLQVWRRVSGARAVTPADVEAVEPPGLVGREALIAFDDAAGFLAKDLSGREERLLHLHNLIVEQGGFLLMTAESPPSRWHCRLPDLRSRLAAALTAELGAPDDSLIEGLLVKLFADRQLRVEMPLVRYLLPRIERSFAAVESLVAAIDKAALAGHREITVPLASQVLAELLAAAPEREG